MEVRTRVPSVPARRSIVPPTVAIPAGTLLRRDPDGTTCRIAIRAFRIGRTPVTNREYAAYRSATGAAAPPWWTDPLFSDPALPVVGVSWHDASAYCRWLSETTGGSFALPAEAEWEFAACGGLTSPATAWGDAIPAGEIPDGPLRAPWPAGRGTPNGYGLCDMGTIVHEWCAEWRDPEPSSPGGPPRRASRGGSWRHRIPWSAPSARSSLPPDYRYSDYGFRVRREADPETARSPSGSRPGGGVGAAGGP